MASQKPLKLQLGRSARAGFTLVEVALAIGIVAFAFVALIALIPAGHTAYRRAIDISVCSQIAQRIINDAQQTDFNTLIDQVDTPTSDSTNPYFTFRAPLIASPTFRYFDDQGREIIPTNGAKANIPHVIYVVNTRITPWYQLPTSGTANAAVTDVPPQPLAMVTVQVAHNPGNNVLLALSTSSPTSATDPERNLWVTSTTNPGIEVYTYIAYVGRNF